MLNTVVESFTRFLKQPTLLAPAIFLVIVQAILIFVFFSFNDTLPRFYYELFVLNIFPDAPLFETLFLVLLANIEELFFLFVLSVLWIGTWLWMIYSFVRTKQSNESPIAITFSTLKHIGKIIGLAFFFIIILILYAIAMALILWIGFFGGILTLVSLFGVLIWLLIGAFLFFKLMFLPIEFFSKEQKINKAIKNTWSWSGKRLFSIIFFVIIISFIANIILAIGVSISDFIPIEIIAIIVIMFSLAFSTAYFGFALVNYYFAHN